MKFDGAGRSRMERGCEVANGVVEVWAGHSGHMEKFGKVKRGHWEGPKREGKPEK
jgi:hypothetical protein